MEYPPAIPLIGDFIRRALAEPSKRTERDVTFIAFQGPQGSGQVYQLKDYHQCLITVDRKSYLTSLLPAYCELHDSLRVVVMSLDDFYLPHDELKSFSAGHADNGFLQGRGLPGTHDLPLLLTTFSKIQRRDGIVEIPMYDKGAYSGLGDRCTEWRSEDTSAIDVVILEGWCVGFSSIGSFLVEKKWNEMEREEQESYPLPAVLEIDRLLDTYNVIWDYFGAVVQLVPPGATAAVFETILGWRTEQEQGLRAKGGGSMTDTEIHAFVKRYMPGYIFFQDGTRKRWCGLGLALMLGARREIISVEEF